MKRQLISHSAAETEELGAEIAAGLAPGDVVVVSGEVGVGKTTLIRGACRRLGVEGPVTSPTFTIGHRYSGRFPVSHLDLYRIGDLANEDPGLLADYLEDDSIAFVEWPAVARPELAGTSVLEVQLNHAGADRRAVEVATRT